MELFHSFIPNLRSDEGFLCIYLIMNKKLKTGLAIDLFFKIFIVPFVKKCFKYYIKKHYFKHYNDNIKLCFEGIEHFTKHP